MSWALVAFFALGALIQALDPGLLSALRRDPSGLGDGELWRVATPLWVQEAGPGSQLALLIVLAVAGPPLERSRGWRVLLASFAAGAIAGEISGYAWNPRGAGVSVAVAGVAAAALYFAARDPADLGADPQARLPLRVFAGIAVAGGILLAVLADNHGPALLAGFAVAALDDLRREH